jgi:plasmid stabilization system protein ParE
MPLRLIWTRRFVLRLNQVRRHIAKDNPEAAERVVSRIVSAAESLADFPAKARMGRRPRTRELVLVDVPYIVLYRPSRDAVEIMTIMHTSQKWTDSL